MFSELLPLQGPPEFSWMRTLMRASEVRSRQAKSELCLPEPLEAERKRAHIWGWEQPSLTFQQITKRQSFETVYRTRSLSRPDALKALG